MMMTILIRTDDVMIWFLPADVTGRFEPDDDREVVPVVAIIEQGSRHVGEVSRAAGEGEVVEGELGGHVVRGEAEAEGEGHDAVHEVLMRQVPRVIHAGPRQHDEQRPLVDQHALAPAGFS